jgi:hypothetical protein
VLTRQNDKSKDDKQIIDKLYRDIDIMKEEMLQKDDRVIYSLTYLLNYFRLWS